jgi:CheY-like chemotaxis protein
MHFPSMSLPLQSVKNTDRNRFVSNVPLVSPHLRLFFDFQQLPQFLTVSSVGTSIASFVGGFFWKVNGMQDGFIILIADRNRHVREFLQRELQADGYIIQVARDGREVLSMVSGVTPPDLLILDMDIPYTGGVAILEQLHEKSPQLPVVIHTFLPEYSNNLNIDMSATIIEKNGNTDCLRAAVLSMIMKSYPERFDAIQSENRKGRMEKR